MGKVVNEYLRLKRIDKDKLYLFKVGSFYIFLGEDADYINNYMVLKKTKFSADLDKCGFPVNSIEDYLRVFRNLKLNVEVIDQVPDENIELLFKDLNIDEISLEDARGLLKELKTLYGF